MADTTRLSAEPRTEFGKGFARRARKAGKIPAVLYGHGTDPQHLSLPAKEFARAMKGGANTILTLDLAGGEELALPKSVVIHPVRDYVEHVDLLIVKRGEKVTVEVPIQVKGEAAAGTVTLNELSTLTVEVEALHIPDHFVLDIEEAEAGTQFLAGQIGIPSNVELITDPEALVLAVQHAPTAEELEAEDAEAAEELGIEQDAPEDESAEGERAGDAEGGSDSEESGSES
ncbi:50S ribosomal protein L25/general stress protein Ctc [Nakamurella aerolata]|uniref:Large ribosomal subunit protein bL25 n=1 Tax=Nakamurella aerolata TaxID=1656892 RepID=A0A849A5H1_9ACTN|nr:50S ribosomal protein L25/general stress protein Ctc [Nakamurella aerolata]